MFESDDYDQILSQFDFPEESAVAQTKNTSDENKILPNVGTDDNIPKKSSAGEFDNKNNIKSNDSTSGVDRPHENTISPKHIKRKMLDAYFDLKSKRKFPGPAGILNGKFKETKDETVCQMELLSQDVDFSQNCLNKDCFDSPLWSRLLEDVKDWNIGTIDTIKGIKQQAIAGNLRRMKADVVTAFIEAIDRSITDPLITLRDCTGSIKCTLHRDAWSTFSQYIVSDYCALVLWKPTVLTTGSAFKKHYLNITLSNIYAIYSSAVLNDETADLPGGYIIACKENFTVIKADKSSFNIENSSTESHGESNGLFDGLDNIFDDEEF